MPVYAALTNGDLPQMEPPLFADNNQKHPKLTTASKVFRFANMGILTKAKCFAHKHRGFGLWRITQKETTKGAISQAPFCVTMKDFQDALDITGWCNKCERFTYGIAMNRKCYKCKQSTQ